jgi:maltooligosyltrehalose trehalohydrolase
LTAVEIMPVGDFSGRWGLWGYDGVFPYAPDASYGRQFCSARR